jgi:hypothetical protein
MGSMLPYIAAPWILWDMENDPFSLIISDDLPTYAYIKHMFAYFSHSYV